MRIGFVGAGRMGAPMVGRLVVAGHHVRVIGRAPEKRSAITALGATAVKCPAEAVHDADVVVLCVFTDEQVRQVCLDDDLPAAMPSGSVLVLHTTGSPRTAEAVAAQASAHGVAVVDAPVSGGPHDIAAGRLTVFTGGTDDAVAKARPALSAYADPLLHVGALGAGQKVKLVNNTMFAASIGVVAEGVKLARELGVAEDALLPALTHGSAASRALAGVVARGSVASFIDTVGAFVRKDVEVVRKVVAELGGNLGALDDLANAGLDTPD